MSATVVPPFPAAIEIGSLHVVTAQVPELLALSGVPQPPYYHPEVDTLYHVALSLEQARLLSSEPALHFAVLVHDLGKGVTPRDNWPHHRDHETLGVPLVEAVCERLQVPLPYRELAVLVCRYHLHCHRASELSPRGLRRLLRNLQATEQPERFALFLLACEADARGRLGLSQRSYSPPQLLRDFLRERRSAELSLPSIGEGATDEASRMR